VALLAGGRSLAGGLRLSLIVLQSAALLVFGGRSAMIAGLLVSSLYLVFASFSALKQGTMSLLGAAVALAALALAPATIAFGLYSGFLDAVFSRFVDDSGSANARVVMFELLNQFSFGELMFGPDLDYLESLRRTYGLEQGIENPIIRMLLYQGGFAMVLLIGVLVLFFREVIRGRDRAVYWPLLVLMFPLAQRSAASRPSASSMEASNERLRSSIRPMPSKRFQKAQGNR
jgi:hypothetical protein